MIASTGNSDEVTQMILLALKELNNELVEFKQYVGADFEVINLRFDRLEDRMDRLDSNLTYEH